MDFDKVVEAGGFSRMIQHTLSNEFGILSAFLSTLSPEDNNARHKTLKQRVRGLGYGFIPAKGVWDGAAEMSLFVPNMSREDVATLAAEFGQEAYVHGADGKYQVLHTDTGGVLSEGQTGEDFRQFDESESPTAYTEVKDRKWKWIPKEDEEKTAGAFFFAFAPREAKYIGKRHGFFTAASADDKFIRSGKSRGHIMLAVSSCDFLLPIDTNDPDWVTKKPGIQKG